LFGGSNGRAPGHYEGIVRREPRPRNDNQHVVFEVESNCKNIAALGGALKDQGPIDAYEEIAGRSVLLKTARETLTGCCAGCAVPAGLFKAVQVAAGLALPQDIGIKLSKG
jgi:hypothetical protein